MKKRELSKMEIADFQTLIKFVGIYCRQVHGGEKTPFSFRLFDINKIEKKETLLCEGCIKILSYDLIIRIRCPHHPKPMCKKCETQCYHGEYKSKIREIMKYSGMHMIKHGRVDMLYHYFRRTKKDEKT